MQQLGRIASRECEGASSRDVIARREATKQSIFLAARNGLLRFARNDEKAGLRLAMTPFADRNTVDSRWKSRCICCANPRE